MSDPRRIKTAEFTRLFNREGLDITENPGAAEPAPPSTMTANIRKNSMSTKPPSLGDRFIRNLSGKIVGVSGGTKKVNSSVETPFYNLLEASYIAETREQRLLGTSKALGKEEGGKHHPGQNRHLKTNPPTNKRGWWMDDDHGVAKLRVRAARHANKQGIQGEISDSITPFYDSLVQEDMTTADVASFELPLRNGGLSQQFDKQIDKKKKKYYKLAMIAASMAGSGGSY